MQESRQLSNKVLDVTVVIAGLGYFIDMYDFFLFNMLRVPSLTELGLSGEELTQAGLMISSWQMVGILVGALLWGALADLRGRKTGLLASILVYGVGSILTAFVTTPALYAAARFITSVGLAGEIGAGIALISERLNAQKRGFGVMVFLSAGYIGVICAGLASALIPWRANYVLGGVAGLAILLTRTRLPESQLFLKVTKKSALSDVLVTLIQTPKKLFLLACGVCLLMTATFSPQIIWTLSPEIGKGLGITQPIQASTVLMIGFAGATISDLLAQFLSEKFKSRKKAVAIFLLLSAVIFSLFICCSHPSYNVFLLFNGMLGVTFGVWMVTVVWLSEHFGTNVRATAATVSPSIARAMTVPMNIVYAALKGRGAVAAVGTIGAVILTLAIFGWLGLKETYGRDLDYTE